MCSAQSPCLLAKNTNQEPPRTLCPQQAAIIIFSLYIKWLPSTSGFPLDSLAPRLGVSPSSPPSQPISFRLLILPLADPLPGPLLAYFLTSDPCYAQPSRPPVPWVRPIGLLPQAPSGGVQPEVVHPGGSPSGLFPGLDSWAPAGCRRANPNPSKAERLHSEVRYPCRSTRGFPSHTSNQPYSHRLDALIS